MGLLNTKVPKVVRPPEPLNGHQWRLMVNTMLLAGVAGFAGVVTTQTITFIVDEFGSSKRHQGIALGVIRCDIVVSLALMAVADRIGRRRALITAAIAGPLFTALCALTPSLPSFTGTQLVARGFTTATAGLIGIMLVEELPASSRAWGASLVLLAGAAGAASLLVLLPVAGQGIRAWRILFLVPLLGLLPLLGIWRNIGESHRFAALAERRSAGLLDAPWQQHVGRLAIIAVWVGLLSLFITPARQFANDFLREERGFSPTDLSRYGLLTNVPALLGVPLGGAIADRKGRRLIAGWGLIGYAIATAGAFLLSGPSMWAASLVSALMGSLTLPALSVMVSELFPTELRSSAAGFAGAINRGGGVIGLVLVGFLSDSFNIGPTAAALAPALIIGTLVMMRFFPEAAGKELEEISGDPRAVEAPKPIPIYFG